MRIATATSGIQERTFGETALLRLILVSMMVGQIGLITDMWYHRHTPVAIESFFTWPHAMLYSGWASSGLILAAYLLESVARGEPRGRWLPPGYPLVLLGTALFGLGGGFDFTWHTLFGFEQRLEVFLSPAHLLLSYSSLIGVVGVFRVAIERRARAGVSAYRPRWADFPVLLTLTVLFRGTLWPLIYSQPLAIDYAAGGTVAGDLPGFAGIAWENTAAQVAGLNGILLYSVLLALFVVVPLRRLRLPGGAIAAVMLWEGALIAATTDMWRYLPAVAGAALLGEALWAALWRGRLGGLDGRPGYWVLAGALPAALALLYFALIAAVGGGITWTTPLWAGAVTLAGLYGLITGLFALPPHFLRAPLAARES